MTPLKVKQTIKELLSNAYTLQVGFCSAQPFDTLKDHYNHRLESSLACDLELREDLALLVEPRMTFEAVKSFVVIAVPYAPYEAAKDTYGNISSGCASTDYHITLKKILEPLQSKLKEAYDIDGKIIIDTSPLSDRSLAVRSGLGIIRRNGMCYNPKYGSYFYIGALMIDYDLEVKDFTGPDDPCGPCRRCVAFCPNQAIEGNYEIDSNRCVSYLTQKKVLKASESVALGSRIYGCEVCQTVCPANRGQKNPDELRVVDHQVNYKKLLEISNADFKATYKKTASGWRGKRTLQRNALAALGNSGDKANIGLIEPFMEDPREIIRDEAIRAYNRLNKEEA